MLDRLSSERQAQANPRTARPSDPKGWQGAYVWYVLCLLAVVNLFNYMDRTALSVLMPSIKRDLSLSDGQLGLLVGFAFFLFYAVCGVPIARLSDSGSRKRIITIALAIWSIMTALSGAAQNFWQLLGARIGLAAGEAGCIPASQSLVADVVDTRRRPMAYAILGFGTSAGAMVGLIIAGMLGDIIGWRWTFAALGLPGLLLALLVQATLREPLRGAFDPVSTQVAGASFGETARWLWNCLPYRLLVGFYIFNGLAYAGLLQWWPSFFERVFRLDLANVGLSLGLALGIGSAIGILVGGFVASKSAKRGLSLPLKFGAATIAAAFVTTLGSLFAPTALISTECVLVTFLLWSCPTGALTATMVTVTPPHMRATAAALIIFLMSVLGFGLGPFLVGLLSDQLTPSLGAESLRYALLLPASALAPLAAFLFAIAKSLPPDTSQTPSHDRPT